MLPLFRCSPGTRALSLFRKSRHLSSTAPKLEKPLPPRIKFNDADLTLSYLKGSGPGGQKINKTNSAVQLTHNPTGIVVKCQATRSQSQNEKIARQLLADKVEQVLRGDQSRVAIKTDRARKKKASKLKKSRRKYRSLEQEEGEGKEEEGEEGEGEQKAEDSRDEKRGQE